MNVPLRGLRAFAAPLAVAALTLPSAAPASAHHLMELTGAPEGSWSGLMSGLAHPLVGVDHLLFLLAIGLVGLHRPLRWVPLLLAVGLAGSGLGLVLPGLPGAEALAAASLILVALVLQCGWDTRLLLPAIALHGYVLSGSVLGWEPTPLLSYLLGLLLSQGALLLLAIGLVRRWRQQASPQAFSLLCGGLIGVGSAFAWAALRG
jgi:urease accessory protein